LSVIIPCAPKLYKPANKRTPNGDGNSESVRKRLHGPETRPNGTSTAQELEQMQQEEEESKNIFILFNWLIKK
jgi:hypothetical protein